MIKKLILHALFALALAGCATAPETPQQAVFAAKTTYATALTAAVAYKRLAPCTTVKMPCSDPAIVVQLQKADNVAAGALDAAESAVRTPGFGKSLVSSAVASAQAAIGAFLSITSTLGVSK